MPTRVKSAFEARVKAGTLHPDDAQRHAVDRLDQLAYGIARWRPRNGLIGRLFGSDQPPVRGLYIHGKVGRGKTMLMDLFYGQCRFTPKRRVHFHAFMSDVHDRIAIARKTGEGDPLPGIGADLARDARLLCFDEFHITDIADAMILGRLFTAMFEAGVVVVATSNVRPSNLYRNGLNRALFLPFIALLEQRLDVVELEAARDYRLERLAGQKLYLDSTKPTTTADVRAIFERLTGIARGAPHDLDVKGRKVRIAETANGVAIESFDGLCNRPLGAVDYLHLAQGFHTIIVTDVPMLDRDRRAETRRFISLVDTLYDAGICLIVSAAAEPDHLCVTGDEAFLFERTASRLNEMRSADYLATHRSRRLEKTAPSPVAPS